MTESGDYSAVCGGDGEGIGGSAVRAPSSRRAVSATTRRFSIAAPPVAASSEDRLGPLPTAAMMTFSRHGSLVGSRGQSMERAIAGGGVYMTPSQAEVTARQVCVAVV